MRARQRPPPRAVGEVRLGRCRGQKPAPGDAARGGVASVVRVWGGGEGGGEGRGGEGARRGVLVACSCRVGGGTASHRRLARARPLTCPSASPAIAPPLPPLRSLPVQALPPPAHPPAPRRVCMLRVRRCTTGQSPSSAGATRCTRTSSASRSSCRAGAHCRSRAMCRTRLPSELPGACRASCGAVKVLADFPRGGGGAQVGCSAARGPQQPVQSRQHAALPLALLATAPHSRTYPQPAQGQRAPSAHTRVRAIGQPPLAALRRLLPLSCPRPPAPP